MSHDRLQRPELVDWILGELDGEQRERTREAIGSDPSAALEAAELRTLLEDMRVLETEPSGSVSLAMRYAVKRRRALQQSDQSSSLRVSGWLSPTVFVRAAAVAAIVLLSLIWWQEMGVVSSEMVDSPRETATLVMAEEISLQPAAEPELPRTQLVLDAVGPSLERHYVPIEQLRMTDVFTSIVGADNELATLRLEFTRRFSRETRRESIRASGGTPGIEGRIQDLATTIAENIERRLQDGEATVEETALALRALLASGSTTRIGHRAAVRAAYDDLADRVDELEGGELANALAALTDFAVVASGRAAELVARNSERMARSTMELTRLPVAHTGQGAPAIGRPVLLRFPTRLSCLADAGHVLRLAPAFGADPELTRRARWLIAAHLDERWAAASGERPDLTAAQLYGFADLFDRDEMDERLRLWRPDLVVSMGYVTLHHLVWSQAPPRPGWARLQTQLRAVATMPTPPDVGDASALLLALAMNFAAPGVHSTSALGD